MTTVQTLGKYTLVYDSELGHATVLQSGLLVPVVKFSADDPGAFEACQQWAKENQ